MRHRVQMHEVRCLIEEEVMGQLERCKQLLSSKHPAGLDYNLLLRELAGGVAGATRSRDKAPEAGGPEIGLSSSG